MYTLHILYSVFAMLVFSNSKLNPSQSIGVPEPIFRIQTE
jgi:hypothetical protein